MRWKGMGSVAGISLLAALVWVGTLSAQEDEEPGARVRVMAFGQGSYLGVYISDVSADDVDRLGLREERGVLVTGVADGGPAQEAGLEENDVILEWNGDRLESETQLRRILAETPAGRSATLGVFRDGSTRSIEVELGEREGLGRALTLRSGWDEDAARDLRGKLKDMNVRIERMPRVFMSMRGGRLGVGIQSLEPQLADYFGLGDQSGVLITTVREDSPAASGGLKAGDVILAVDGETVEDAGDVSRLVWSADAGPVAIRILRDRKEQTLTVELPEAENRWQSGEGEEGSFFFGTPFDVQVAPGEVNVEWSQPGKVLEDVEVLEPPSAGFDHAPARLRPLSRARVLAI
jgi:serine protease Do